MKGKLLIFAAPSGSGKSTIVNYIMQQGLNTHFSISSTTRKPRGTEQNGVEYFFLSEQEFRDSIARDEFVEYEEVYAGIFYGSRKSQVESQLERGENVVFDVDVNGGINIKKHYGDRAMSVFIMPPSKEELIRRLKNRGTDSEEVIRNRMLRVDYEMEQACHFDHVVINDNLDEAKAQVLKLVKDFLSSNPNCTL
ncbi:MAG: guanylate kinase [Prevotellaceae bacterium]|nr:guanylate kinase [Prevotellaceae bacterium]